MACEEHSRYMSDWAVPNPGAGGASDSRQSTGQSTHTSDEIRDAINSLSAAEIEKLTRYARWHSNDCAGSWDHEDLLQESVRATIEGRRNWPRTVSFAIHLLGCIRSTASAWRKRWRQHAEITDAIENSSMPPDQGRLVAAHIIDKTAGLLIADCAAIAILEALMDGELPRETIRRLRVTQKAYDATRKRIRRQLVKSIESLQGGHHVQ